MLVNPGMLRKRCSLTSHLSPLTSKIFEPKIFIYETGDLEDDFAVHCQYSDGCTDGIRHDIVFRTWSTGAALGARW